MTKHKQATHSRRWSITLEGRKSNRTGPCLGVLPTTEPHTRCRVCCGEQNAERLGSRLSNPSYAVCGVTAGEIPLKRWCSETLGTPHTFLRGSARETSQGARKGWCGRTGQRRRNSEWPAELTWPTTARTVRAAVACTERKLSQGRPLGHVPSPWKGESRHRAPSLYIWKSCSK